MQYVSSAGEDDRCIFCAGRDADDDEAARVVHRGALTIVMLNAFPYNTGHLMVAPMRHVGELHDCSTDERQDIMETTTASVGIVRDAMAAQGFNVGLNLGRVAGAGIPGHLHVHVVPRWGGDTNFMPVIGDTKVLPEMLADTYSKLRARFDAL
jgi:ATP adenylyltransferase